MSRSISTYPVYLMLGEQSDDSMIYRPLVEIKDFSDINGNVEAIDKTTTSNTETSYIQGAKTNELRQFTCNYNKADFDRIEALKGQEQYIAILFGREGEYGKFVGESFISVFINGGGVNEVVNMTVSINVTEGLYEAFDPILVDWTTNTGNVIQNDEMEYMQLNIAPYKNLRKLLRNGIIRQNFDFLR